VWEGEWNDPTGAEVAQRMAEAVAKGVELVPQLHPTGDTKTDKNGNTKYTKIDHVKIYQSKLDAAQKKREQVLTWMDALMDYGMVLDIPAWVGRSPVGAKNSGIGSYHGRQSFITFSHAKSVMKTPTWFDPDIKYPPYKGKLWLLKTLLR
jgi:hypothetical protein